MFLGYFLSADSEFVIENLLKSKGNPEISARGKSTLFFAVLDEQTGTHSTIQINLATKMCGIKNYITYVKLVIFGDNLLGKNVKKHEKSILLSVLTVIHE